MIKGVLFDLDGTLIDSTDAILASFFHTFDTLGLARPTRQAILDSIGFPLRQQLGILTTHDADAFIQIYRAHYTETSREATTLLPGAKALLEALAASGIAMGFATSKKRSAAEMLLDHLGVLDHFQARIGPDDVTHPKPHPEAVEVAVQALGLTAEQVVFIGDMHFDIEAGKAAGVYTLGVATGYATREELEALAPHGLIDSLDEVLPCLRALGLELAVSGV